MGHKRNIIVQYDNFQSHSGIIALGKTKFYHFVKIDVSANNLIVYVSNNGFTDSGRIGAIYSLDEYNVIFAQTFANQEQCTGEAFISILQESLK